MAARHKARRRALDLLFEAEQRHMGPVELIAERMPIATPPIPEYSITLVEGVVEHSERIDEALATYAQGWALDRMPAVDRALLRMSTYELVWEDDVPDPVVIDEAVQLAKELSTDESPAFVNGLLNRLMGLKADLLD